MEQLQKQVNQVQYVKIIYIFLFDAKKNYSKNKTNK